MREFADMDALAASLGREVAVSDWVEITQERVNQFADATGDHQWIHVDVERCRRESPFKGTIAHGFLTLSLLSGMMENALRLGGSSLVLNYGLNKVRFPAPVPVGSRLRAHLTPARIEPIEGGTQLCWDVVVEREGSAKPVCVAQSVMRQYA